ncbi:MAG: long-chain fatty acid--CoA ligase [Rhizobacter sp.]|nr:long-chain fatty acid--CoA ligase [Chlorobiales bacterium]
MPLLDPSFKTLPDLFKTVFRHYARSNKAVLARKVGGRYEEILYASLEADVLAFAAYLKSIGVEKGDRLAILSENRPAWVTADMAAAIIGAITVPLYPSLPPNQISYILRNADCKVIVASTGLQLGKVKKISADVSSLRQIISMNAIDKPGTAAAADSMILELEAAKEKGKAYLDLYPESINIQVDEEDIATLIYTSGTTGNPKGVMLTHRNICENIKSCSKVILLDETDAALSFLPLSHAYERTAGYYLMFACGVTISYAESIETVSLNLTEVKPTIVITVPRLFERIKSTLFKTIDAGSVAKKRIFYWAVDVGYKLAASRKGSGSGLGSVSPVLSVQAAIAERLVFSTVKARFGGRIRYFVSGGAALPRETGEFFQAVGIKVLEGFGLTETSPVTHVNRPELIKFGTVGPALANVEVKIASDGEILLKGPNIMKGYWRDEAATHEVLKDGWLYTGDIGEIDHDGYLKITDRKKHIIVNSGGKNIAPLPIESLIGANRYVEQAVVLGERRPFLVALVVPNFESLKSFAREHSLSFGSDQELMLLPEVRKLYEKMLKEISQGLAGHEKVRKFHLIEKQFSIDEGEMTPTLKLKRKVIEQKFAAEIDALYKGLVYEAD